MTPDELKKYFPGASASTIKRNAYAPALATIPSPKPQQEARPLEPRRKAQKAGTRSPAFLVTIISLRNRELDDDNFIGGCKPLRDAVAEHLGCPDSKKFIRFHYCQVVSSTKCPGTIVMIERLKL